MVIDADGAEKQELHSILKHKGTLKRRQYLVRFVRQTDDGAVWMTQQELKNAKEMMAEYELSVKMRASSSRKG